MPSPQSNKEKLFNLNNFKAGADKTTVQNCQKMADLAQLEQFIAKGFKEGTAAAMNNLEELSDT